MTKTSEANIKDLALLDIEPGLVALLHPSKNPDTASSGYAEVTAVPGGKTLYLNLKNGVTKTINRKSGSFGYTTGSRIFYNDAGNAKSFFLNPETSKEAKTTAAVEGKTASRGSATRTFARPS